MNPSTFSNVFDKVMDSFFSFRSSLFLAVGMICLGSVTSQGDVFHRHPHPHDHQHDHDDHEFCGTEVPSLEQEMMNQVRINAFQAVTNGTYERRRNLQTESCRELCDQCIEIEVYLHLIATDLGFGSIIPHPDSALDKAIQSMHDVTIVDFSTKGQIAAMFEENIKVVNEAFSGTPFRFKFIAENTTQTTNNTWSESVVSYKEEVGALLGTSDLRKLDCFLAHSLRPSKGNGEILGTATLPGSQRVGKGDGVYVRYDVLPGGGRRKNDMGYTLVHEIGHWLGLLHTFQSLATLDPCDAGEEGYNDFVDDTPIHNGPSSRIVDDCRDYLGGASKMPDSCPNLPGRDPLFNYLNYAGYEECLAQEGYFTCGQIERMYKHWLLFRDEVTSCENPYDMEIEVIFIFDAFHGNQNTFRLLSEDGDILLDSVEDHWVAYMVEREESLYVDLCLPRSMEYRLIIWDSGGNGFVDGSIEIFTDREISQHVRGNFGERVVVDIPSQPMRTMGPTTSSEPTLSPIPSSEPSSKPSLSHIPTWSLAPTLSIAPSTKPSISSVPTQSTAPTATALSSVPPSYSRGPTQSQTPTVSTSRSKEPTHSLEPTQSPSHTSTPVPTTSVSLSKKPTLNPSIVPSTKPSTVPSDFPSLIPTASYTNSPSLSPSDAASELPSKRKTTDSTNSSSPSSAPSEEYTIEITSLPSQSPSINPTLVPASLIIKTETASPMIASASLPSAPNLAKESTISPSDASTKSSDLAQDQISTASKPETVPHSSAQPNFVLFSGTLCFLWFLVSQ